MGLQILSIQPKLNLYIPREITSRIIALSQAGLEAAFQVPMPGDSGLSPNDSSISNYCLTQENFTPTPHSG